MDEFAQAGKEGLQYAYSKHIPVMIMEPLKGGRLANRLPEQAIAAFRASGKQRTPAEWGLALVVGTERSLSGLVRHESYGAIGGKSQYCFYSAVGNVRGI